MSRCFPFPPPGYTLNGIRDEAALIESIKGAEEKAKREQRRKERKRDKKEKKDKRDKKDRKEKKDKKRERGDEGESSKHSHKRRRKEEGANKDVQNNQKVDVFHKLKETETDCLEKSSLTVERELLLSTSQNSCESTLDSSELPKQKEKQPVEGRHNNNNDSESIIWIRLPIRRPKVPEVTNKVQQKPCPSPQIKLETSQLVTREQPQHPCSTSAPEHSSKPHEEKRKAHIRSTKLGKEKKRSSTTKETSQPSGLCRLCPPSVAAQFLNVVENWVPSTIESRVVELTNSEDDECWWSKKRPSSHKFETERCKQVNRNNETKQVISSSIAWPCARLLPEADVYALPYTVPF